MSKLLLLIPESFITVVGFSGAHRRYRRLTLPRASPTRGSSAEFTFDGNASSTLRKRAAVEES